MKQRYVVLRTDDVTWRNDETGEYCPYWFVSDTWDEDGAIVDDMMWEQRRLADVFCTHLNTKGYTPDRHESIRRG